MCADVHFLKEADLPAFLQALGGEPFFATVRRQDQITYEKLSPEQRGQAALRCPPPVESVKSFFFPARERVAVYGADAGEQAGDAIGSQVIVGARACDLAALHILDQVFLQEETGDPFYGARRRQSALVTVDCVEPGPYCFCNLVGGQPFVKDDFDLNLSPVDSGYVVALGSDKAKEQLGQAKALLGPAQPEQLAQREEQRQGAQEVLRRQNEGLTSPVDVPPAAMNKAIQRTVEDAYSCVECGACSYICPTCHCFFLFDQRGPGTGEQFERHKTWDSCLMANFAKMAGVGGLKPTPRAELRSRFENRLRHKFEWMVENLNVIGCVGCGRCEAACMGGSDVKTLFKELKA